MLVKGRGGNSDVCKVENMSSQFERLTQKATEVYMFEYRFIKFEYQGNCFHPIRFTTNLPFDELR